MTELIVIRHGETDWNRQHRFQGQIDVPLNHIGLAQAERLGQRLADEPIDVLVCSDLQRARLTAEPLMRGRGLAAGLQPLWRQQGFGLLEGLDVPTIRGRQNAIACCSISGSRPKARNTAPPAQASAAYIGRLSAPAQIAIHVACEARQRRRLPSA